MPLELRGSTSVDCLLGPANTSVALSVARLNCANPPHKLRKSLSQIAQTNPLNCANPYLKLRKSASQPSDSNHGQSQAAQGFAAPMWSSLRKTKPKRIATWSAKRNGTWRANETQNGAQRTQSGAQIVSTQAEGLELGLVTCPATACWPANYSPQTFPELVKGSRFRG